MQQIAPLGSHLVCPSCYLFHIHGDCGHWHKENESNCNNVTLDNNVILFKPKPKTRKPKQYKPYKSKFLKCYGTLLDNGEFDTSFFARGDYAFIKPFFNGEKGEFFNAKAEADWLSVSAYKNARCARTEKNISHVLCGFLDLDGDNLDIPLTEDMIRQRCNLLGLSMPMIIETSPNRYHIKFYYISPEAIKRKWKIKAVQRGLHEAFKDMGSDAVAAEDLTRFLRNESQVNAVNKKYRREHKPRVTVVENGQLCTLDQLYRILKKHGFIKRVEWPSRFGPDNTPIEESRSRLIEFLKDNSGYLSTYEELADKLNIAIRTLKKMIGDLRREGKLTTELVGRWGDRKTRFTAKFFEVHIKESLNTYLAVCTPKAGGSYPDTPRPAHKNELGDSFFMALIWAKAIGLSPGVRNFAFFGFALWLKASKKLTYEEVFRELYQVLIVTPDFSRREFEKTVMSACRDRYRYCISAKKFEKVFLSLGVLDSH